MFESLSSWRSLSKNIRCIIIYGINLSVLDVWVQTSLRANIIPSSGQTEQTLHLDFLTFCTFRGSENTLSSTRSHRACTVNGNPKNTTGLFILLLKKLHLNSLIRFSCLAPAPWEGFIKPCGIVLMKVCVAATMKTQTGEEKSSNHRHRLDLFTQPRSFRLSLPPPPLKANTQVLHHTVSSSLSCIVQLLLLCGLQAGFFFSCYSSHTVVFCPKKPACKWPVQQGWFSLGGGRKKEKKKGK